MMLTVGMNAWAQDADYLCFTAEEDEAYFQLYKYGNPTKVALEYSTNGGSSWTDYTYTAADGYEYGPVIILQNAGDKVYFRNKSDKVTNFSTSAENYYRFSIRNNKISVSGNVMSLVDKRCAKTTIPNNYCFAKLFEYCTSITSAPKLPATELKEGCYYRMFTGCNNLTNAPTLPARTLKSYCYYEMFQGCTSLSHVEVGFTEWVPSGTTDALKWWMQGVSQTGTFECPKDLDTSSRSNYIPDGWTISQYMPDYLCFTTEKDASICLEKEGSPTAVTIEYSKDGMKWNTLTLYEYVEFQSGETLYLRNASETVTEFSKGGRDYYHFRLSSSDDSNRISASGNIMSLVDKSCNTKTIPCNYCFYELFSGNRNLTSAPKLPATTLAIECYENMFEDCTGLTEAPALPATSLSHACYSNMFSGCTGLVNAPELATTTLAEGCYRSMFQGCTGLTVAPELPATTLVRGCYENMFGDCTGLTEAPELPAPTLVEKCYYGMFDNCSNLRKVNVSFKEWFKLDKNGATAGWLGDVAEEGEFICPPGLPKLTGSSSYIPENWTVKAPDYLCFTANTTSSSKVSLSKVGSPADVALEYSKDASVWKPYTLGEEISLSPFASVYFRNPSRTPTAFSTDGANYYRFSVEGDVAASGNIMTLVEKSGSITEIPNDYCFYGLFSGCTGLTASPELPATTLANYCYYGMFKDCSSLNYIKVGFSQWHENATRDWVSGVAAKGTFDSPVELDKTKLGTSYIPVGWTLGIYHPTKEPTYRTLGYTQDCWEDRATGKFYSDAECTQELNPAQVFTYKKLITNPVTANNGFTLKDATYEGVQFNWAAETTYKTTSAEHSETGTRSVEFIVYGKDVANARVKWYKDSGDYRYGKFTITVYVNGTQVYSVNQNDNKSLSGFFAVPLQGLKTGDVVKFEVKKPETSEWKGNVTIAACLEYTSSDGGEREVIHHDAVEPTDETVGFNQECWEAFNVYKFYSDAACTQELNPAQLITYKKLISLPVTANNGFTLKEDATYDGVQFDWAAETSYGNAATDTRSVEFIVYGKDVDNARVKWYKNNGDYHCGKFTIIVYVNGTKVYSVNQDDNKSLDGLFAVPLQGLKMGDVVKFEVKKPEILDWDGNVTIAACLEYTSSNEGEAETIHHDAVAPTDRTVGYTQECWEAFNFYKFYSDAACTQELNPAQLITYKKLISLPVTANNGFTIKDAAYGGVQFDWAAETTYKTTSVTSVIDSETGTRSVEFTVYGTDVDNARVKWNKTSGDYRYGKFTITVYVNGTQVYSINQDDNKSLSGFFAVPLQGLKKGDKVKFEVKKPEKSKWSGNVTIAACLEYTSSNGGLNEDIIHHDATEPEYETVGNIEYWENKETGKYYSDAFLKNELNPEMLITYKKLISLPVTANNGFTIKDAAYGGVQFDWAAETSYGDKDRDIRSVEFIVYGKDVDNARVKWTKNNPDWRYGQFTINVYVNGTQVYSINQDNGESLGGLFAVPLQGLKTGDVVKFEVQKPYSSYWTSNVTIAACLEYTSSNGGEAETIHHDAVEPTYETVGFNQECWEAFNVYKFYSDAACTQELNPAQLITYAKFITTPIIANDGFTIKDVAYSDVQFDWAAETSYDTYAKGTRSVEFMVFGKDVGNARVKWTKNNPDWAYGQFTINVYVNGTQVYSINQDNGESLGGLFAVPLQGLKTGDVVKFEVQKPYSSYVTSNVTIAACLEYTSSNGGAGVILTADDKFKNKGDDDPELTWKVTKGELMEGDELTGIKIWREEGEEIGSYTIHVSQEEGSNPKYYITFVEGTFRISDIIHHDVTEPTYETVGFLQECWEDRTLGKYYSDAEYSQELNPAQLITYKKLISLPVTANNGFTLVEDAAYGGVQFNWAAETTYDVWSDTDTRSVEFIVYGKDVDNARVKWYKNNGDYQYGKFTITVYVNGTQVYSVNQNDNKSLSGLFAVPLQGLKMGDVVKFEVKKPEKSEWTGNVTIAACLEYTSSNGGLNEDIIHHDATEPEYETVGNIEYWEDKKNGKYYSDIFFMNELNPEMLITYKKLISNPVTANNGFTLVEDAAYGGVQFNWAAETTYKTTSDLYSETGTRSVEFTVYGTDVANARVKWTKTAPNWQYGQFTINVYVNGTQVYSVNQDDKKSLSGFFAVSLQGLKTGDVVKFEVQKPYSSDWAGNVTIAACLEYTSSNGGLNGELVTANQDPNNKDYYYSTFYSSTDAYQLPGSVTAYTGRADGNVLHLTAIEGSVIPAGEPVILRLTTSDNAATQKQIALALTTSSVLPSDSNTLVGTDTEKVLEDDCFALSCSPEYGVGFYSWSGMTIGAHKAYLNLAQVPRTRPYVFVFDDGTTTGTEQYFESQSEQNKVPYNLQGMPVDESYRGLIILDGKLMYKE
ncbi:MAG: leucine-rich repeat protein [Bacteroidaceae bacterium]|nr:leucine-rich repeat protein [Bacteroidaceae bacterium]